MLHIMHGMDFLMSTGEEMKSVKSYLEESERFTIVARQATAAGLGRTVVNELHP